MPHSATLATRLGAELKARILPQRGDAALAPHKSSCFCSEQGGENRWSPLSPPLPSSRAYQPDLAYFIYPARYSVKLTPSASRYDFRPLSVSRSRTKKDLPRRFPRFPPLGRSPSSVAKVHFRGNGIRVTATLFIASDEDST